MKNKKKERPVRNKVFSFLNKKPSITLGRPVKSAPKHNNQYQCHQFFARMFQEGWKCDPYDLWNPTGGSVIPESRNMIVDTFMSRDHEYLLFIDDDQCFPGNTEMFDWVKMLIDDDKDIVAAVTVRKFPPYSPNIAMWDKGGMVTVKNWPEDKLFKVHQVGFGMVLIKRKVIETLMNTTIPPSPIFHDPLQYNPGMDDVHLRGEDYAFCNAAIMHGFDIWVDPRIPLLHIGDYPFSVEDFKAYKDQIKQYMVDLCQDTDLYAPIAEALRKSGQRFKNGPVRLSDVHAGMRQKETTPESSSQPTKESDTGTPTQTLTEKKSNDNTIGGNNSE